MPRTAMRYPIVKGLRLSTKDAAKLEALAMATQQPPADVLRWLIRTAQPMDVAPFRFETGRRKARKHIGESAIGKK